MKIWILNHYATDMYLDGTGRHQGFAKYLIKKGHDVTIFCASTVHNSDVVIDTENKQYIRKIGKDDVPYVFVKTSQYKDNGIKRIQNIVEFYFKIKNVIGKLLESEEKPDVILASSAHLLTLVAGVKLSNRHSIPCICEIRDLWPESIVAYGIAEAHNPLIILLRKMEKWVYKKSKAIIFTMAGGYEYIIDQGWEKEIPKSKVKYISNGIDLELHDYNKINYTFKDEDLDDDSKYKIVYTGSLRKANEQIYVLLDIIKIMQKEKYNNYQFLIYGKGDLEDSLKKICASNGYKNVKFKGFVEKKYIPYILSKCNLNVLNCVSHDILRYGGSQNKLFDYLASGNPIISGENSKYSIIALHKCGISKNFETPSEIVSAIEELALNPIDYKYIRKIAEKYDLKKLTDKLLELFKI